MFPTLLQFRPLRWRNAKALLAWRYPPPDDFYNAPDESPAAVDQLLRPELHYLSVLDERGELIGFRCFGPDARVSGGDYGEDALDMGGGLRPDLTGRGLGRHVITAAMNHAIGVFSPRQFRTTVAAFNRRALKVCESLGYRAVREFERSSDGATFVILAKAAQVMRLAIPLVAPGTPAEKP